MSILAVNGLKKSFSGGVRALSAFELDVEPGEFVTFLGPSGCGKTTTLRCIAGLERPDSGTITIDGEVVYSANAARHVDLPPERRGLAMVFQQYALWPHLTVFENVAFGLRARHFSKADIMSKTERALRSVRLWDQRERQITQLSGGQQQRIALARAIAPDPKVVLFDEPLSNLDVKLRESMRIEILELQRRLGLTSIYVTHDQDEAFSLSSRIVVMNSGQIEQVATPEEVWEHPATAFVAGFVGTSTRLVGAVKELYVDGTARMQTTDGLELRFAASRTGEHRTSIGDRAVAFIRAGDLEILSDSASSTSNDWRAEIELESFHGDYTLVFLRVGEARFSYRARGVPGQRSSSVRLHVDPDRVYVYRDDSDTALARESTAVVETDLSAHHRDGLSSAFNLLSGSPSKG